MGSVAREKWPPIDLVKLVYGDEYTYKDWNMWLGKCEDSENITSLVSVFYGIQKGMQVAVQNKMNKPKVVHTFIRMQASIEKTLKRIWRKKKLGALASVIGSKEIGNHIQKKRHTDAEFEKWLSGMRY